MKSFKGILFIVFTMVLTVISWYFATPREDIHVVNKLVHLVGSLTLTEFLLVFQAATVRC